MARGLRELLNATEPAYSFGIRDLEKQSGSKAVDIALLHEVTTKTNAKIAELGLDASDTRDEELYMQLQKMMSSINQSIFPEGTNVKSLIGFTAPLPFAPIPTIKPTVLKKILRLHPPKQLMKKLGFTSLESFLKRADAKQISLGIFLCESYSWHKKFSNQVKNLTTSDFELKKPTLIFLPSKLYSKNLAIHSTLSGVVGLDEKVTPSMHQLLDVVAKLRHVHLEGVYLKGRYNQPDFISSFVGALYQPVGTSIKLRDIPVPWESIYEIVHNNSEQMLENIDGIVSMDDYKVGSIGSLVADAIPDQCHWFKSTDFLGRPKLSFHINDIAFNSYFKVPLSDSATAYQRAALEATLIGRYARIVNDNSKILEICGAI